MGVSNKVTVIYDWLALSSHPVGVTRSITFLIAHFGTWWSGEDHCTFLAQPRLQCFNRDHVIYAVHVTIDGVFCWCTCRTCIEFEHDAGGQGKRCQTCTARPLSLAKDHRCGMSRKNDMVKPLTKFQMHIRSEHYRAHCSQPGSFSGNGICMFACDCVLVCSNANLCTRSLE